MNKLNGHVWVLFLNDMRMSHIEMVEPVAKGDTREEIEKFLEEEKVPLYQDGPWSKSYRAGGPLEWYNVPLASENPIREVDTRSWNYGGVSALPHVSYLGKHK